MPNASAASDRDHGLLPEVIEALYGCLIDPDRYGELIHRLAALTSAAAAGRIDWDDHARPALLRHVRILEALIDGGAGQARAVAGRPAQDPARPRALIAPDGRILSANEPLLAILGGAQPRGIDGLDLDADGAGRLRQLLARLQNDGGRRSHAVAMPSLAGAMRLYPAKGGAPVLMVASPVRDPDVGPCLLLQAASFAPSDRMIAVLAETFGLTGAESRITALLLAGRGVAEIARLRGSRVDTVRTQIKAILRKTDTHERSALMRLAAALGPFDVPGALRPSGSVAMAPDGHIALGGGRGLAWRGFGARNGRPVLFVHGMLDGWSLPEFWEPRLTEAGLHLIVPARPGFGASEPAPDGADPLQDSLHWSGALLDHLGVGRCVLLAQGSGAPVGWAIAAGKPGRIAGLCLTAGLVPGLSGRVPDELPDWGAAQSALARCAAHSPETAQILLRQCVALLACGGHRAFARSLYETSPHDRAVCADPDLFARIARGYDMMRAQGHAAMAIDAGLVARDWSALPQIATQPAVLLHGDADTATPCAAVADFAARRPETGLRLLSGTAQLLGYRRPEAVIAALQHLAGPTMPVDGTATSAPGDAPPAPPVLPP